MEKNSSWKYVGRHIGILMRNISISWMNLWKTEELISLNGRREGVL